MSSGSICVLVALFATFQCISALKCYNCTYPTDPNCGETFGYDKDSEEASDIIVECGAKYMACRKVVHTDNHGAKTFVERNCWTSNNNGTVKEDFYECKDHSFGEACYCKENDKFPCNAQIRIAPTLATILLAFIPFIGLFL